MNIIKKILLSIMVITLPWIIVDILWLITFGNISIKEYIDSAGFFTATTLYYLLIAWGAILMIWTYDE